MKFKAYILTEGGRSIGCGHITRCISIYQALETRGISPLFIVKGDKVAESALQSKNHLIIDWAKAKKQLFSQLDRDSCVIVDSYLAKREIYNDILRFARLAVFIDDNMRINYPGGIVVNGTVMSENFPYKQQNAVRYYLGSRYIPLRRAFWNVPSRIVSRQAKRLLITMGGADDINFTSRVYRKISEQYPEYIKNVVIGSGFSTINVNAVKKYMDTKTIIYQDIPAEGMLKLMKKCDIAVSAAGQTLYELAASGLPTVAVAVAKNQLYNAKGWENKGFIKYAGYYDETGIIRSVVNSIRAVEGFLQRKTMSRAGQRNVDGRGSQRIAEIIISQMSSGECN